MPKKPQKPRKNSQGATHHTPSNAQSITKKPSKPKPSEGDQGVTR